MLRITEAEKKYTVGDKEITGICDVNIEIGRGEFVSILGRSGCGKTTLLNCISGIDRISSGSIVLDGEEISKLSDDEYADLRAAKIGYVFQNYNLIGHMTALKNVQMALNHLDISAKEKKERALKSLELVGMKKYAGKRPGRLSGGEKQRVAIARALVSEPEIILADEPTGALDSANCAQIMNLLKQINKEKNIAIIMVTHNESLVTETDRVIRMADGHVISDERICEEAKAEKAPESAAPKKTLKTKEAVRLAMHNAMAKKRRTLILALSTSIGIAGVMLVMGIGLGTKTRINKEFEKSFNTKVITAVRTDEFEFSEEVTEKLLSIDNVEDAYPTFAVDIYAGSGEKECDLECVYKETQETMEDILLEGKLPEADSEILVSDKLAQKLTGKSGARAVGSQVEVTLLIKNRDSAAVPVAKTMTIAGIGNTIQFGVLDSAYVSFDSLEKIIADAEVKKENAVRGYSVIIKDKKSRETVIEKLCDLDLDAKRAEELPKEFLGVIDSIVLILALISLISVVVSAVMICLISYMNVTERTREIGILKALGYRKNEIVKIFLAEGSFVGVLSGVIGIGVAFILGNAINRVFVNQFSSMSFEPFRANLLYMIICIAVSMLLGTVCSKNAAGKAAKLDPLKALGYIK